MAVERLPCRSDGCTNTILPAKANDGYCMVCVGKRREAERAEFIRQNRNTIDLYEGIADPVEIIRILHTPRELDPLKQFGLPPKSVEELYASLDSMQADRLMRMAADALRSDGKRLAEEIGKSLATLTDFSLDSMMETWLARNHHRPSVVFRWAGPGIRDRLLDVMDGICGTLNIDHALGALAWIGDQQVCESFLQWEQSPPMWRKELHVGPSSYAHVAGWEPTPRGRRDLFHRTCLAIRPAKSMNPSSGSVELLKEVPESCPWCHLPLACLVELDLPEQGFSFLDISGPKLPVLTCERCTCFSPVFGKIGLTGSARWSEKNVRPKWLPDDSTDWPRRQWAGKKVELMSRRAIHAVDWCMELEASQIGGLPTWVQDSEYPTCPECLQTMTFIAQLDNGYFRNEEGIYYAFLCPDCRMTATTYQQT